MPNIKDRIKELRKEYGYTQEALAKALGLNAKSSIANYENGSNAPSDEIKLRMCKLFNCSIDYLMGKSIYKNYEDYQESHEFALKNISNLNKEEVEEIAILLNYINQHNVKNIDEFIHNEILNFNSTNKETLIRIVSHLHHKFHDKNLPNMMDSIVLTKNSTIDEWKQVETLITEKKNNNNIDTDTDKCIYACPVYRSN